MEDVTDKQADRTAVTLACNVSWWHEREQTSEWFGGYWNAVSRARRHVQRNTDCNSELKHTKHSCFKVQTLHSTDSSNKRIHLLALYDSMPNRHVNRCSHTVYTYE